MRRRRSGLRATHSGAACRTVAVRRAKPRPQGAGHGVHAGHLGRLFAVAAAGCPACAAPPWSCRFPADRTATRDGVLPRRSPAPASAGPGHSGRRSRRPPRLQVRRRGQRCVPRSAAGHVFGRASRSVLTASVIESTPTIDPRPSASASARLLGGTTKRSMPRSSPVSTASSAPCTGRTSPRSVSSPSTMMPISSSQGT